MRFLLNMVRAIGQVLGITPAAMRVPQIQDGQTGGDNSTAEPQRQLVPRGSKPGQRTAKQIILAPSPKVGTLPVPTRTKKSSTSGTSQVTPAPQPAVQKPKRKPKAAPSTKPASSRKPKQKPARPAAKASGATGKQPATRASKTRQHAK